MDIKKFFPSNEAIAETTADESTAKVFNSPARLVDFEMNGSADALVHSARAYLADSMRAISTLMNKVGEIDNAHIVAAYNTLCSAVREVDYAMEISKKIIVQHMIARAERIPHPALPELYHTLRLRGDKMMFSASPIRTTIDPKKLEALLRSKGADVGKYMTPVVTYKVQPRHLGQIKFDLGITKEEIDACRYPMQYKLTTPSFNTEEKQHDNDTEDEQRTDPENSERLLGESTSG